MIENQRNVGDIIDTFLRVFEIVDSGSPEEYADFIKAVSLAIHEIIQTQASREDFASRYGALMLDKLLHPC